MRLEREREGAVLEYLRLRSRQRGGFAECLDLRWRWECGPPHLFPGRQRRAVFRVDDGDPRGWRPAEILEAQRDCFRRTGFSGQEEIPHGDGERAVFAARDEDAIGVDVEACVAELMKKREVVEGGLRNAPFGEQTKAAVEWRFHDALFFKNIRERPVAHHFGEAVA